jgi:hypothetical protein
MILPAPLDHLHRPPSTALAALAEIPEEEIWLAKQKERAAPSTIPPAPGSPLQPVQASGAPRPRRAQGRRPAPEPRL